MVCGCDLTDIRRRGLNPAHECAFRTAISCPDSPVRASIPTCAWCARCCRAPRASRCSARPGSSCGPPIPMTGPDLMNIVDDALLAARANPDSAGQLRLLGRHQPVYLCPLRDDAQQLLALLAVMCRPERCAGQAHARLLLRLFAARAGARVPAARPDLARHHRGAHRDRRRARQEPRICCSRRAPSDASGRRRRERAAAAPATDHRAPARHAPGRCWCRRRA